MAIPPQDLIISGDLLPGEKIRQVELSLQAGATELKELERLNDELSAAIAAKSITDMLRANREFHFSIFELSPLTLFRREITRLWQLSEGYRATYLWLPETRARIIEEHRAIIRALRSFDLDKTIQLSTDHRHASERVVVGLLAAR